ncbi:hypothetical protein MMC17_008820 [Xylographa soralifera]|nr:hypothetical protein [Xylographa soralifera]
MNTFKEFGCSSTNIVNVSKQMQNVLRNGTGGLTDFYLAMLPTALQIFRDEGVDSKLGGKVIVITGASSGIGLETARALSATGATVFLTAHNLKTAETALVRILEAGRVSLVKMDNNSFASIRAAAATILKKLNNQVNILINNAGVTGIPDLKLTEDGQKVHFATNYLSEILLFQLLKPALLASATPDFHSRVINVSSSTHRAGTYANSKVASIYLANEIDSRYGYKGLHATSVRPGCIGTNISRKLGPEFFQHISANEYIVKILKSPEQGAAITVLAAIGKEREHKGGNYLEDCEEAPCGKDDNESFRVGCVSQTYDPKNEERLWKDSLKIVGISDDK